MGNASEISACFLVFRRSERPAPCRGVVLVEVRGEEEVYS